MKVQLYIDPACQLSKVPYQVPNNTHYVRYEEYARLKAEVEMHSKPAIIGGYNISQYIRMANSETLEFDNGDMFADMTLPERIKYIVASHARLKAEVERLTLENSQYEEHHKYGQNVITSLREEVERLTKAVIHSPAAQLKLKELEGKTTYEEINGKIPPCIDKYEAK
jgi:predicted RNase H-like nuclease (RuvC/YqgF family)